MHKSFKSRNMGSGHFVPTSVMHVIRGLWASRSSKNCYVRLWARLLKLKLSICVIRFWSEGADRRAVYNGRVRTYLFGPCRRHGWTTQGWPTGLLNFQFTLFNFAHPFCAYHIVSTGNVPPTSVLYWGSYTFGCRWNSTILDIMRMDVVLIAAISRGNLHAHDLVLKGWFLVHFSC